MAAENWIKMRKNLRDDPRVIAIAEQTHKPEPHIIGALFMLWSLADEHTIDGKIIGVSGKRVDKFTDTKGFSDALKSVGWIIETKAGIEIVRFCDHNGKPAKRRAIDAAIKGGKRSKKSAECPQDVRNLSAECPQTKRTDCGTDVDVDVDLESPPYPPLGGCVCESDKTRTRHTEPTVFDTGAVAIILGSRRFREFIDIYPPHRRTYDRLVADELAKIKADWTDDSLWDEVINGLQVIKSTEEWLKENGQRIPTILRFCAGRMWEAGKKAPERDDCKPFNNGRGMPDWGELERQQRVERERQGVKQ